ASKCLLQNSAGKIRTHEVACLGRAAGSIPESRCPDAVISFRIAGLAHGLLTPQCSSLVVSQFERNRT
ncbi:MAG: hypothetical protein ACYCSN_20320, partial [Acidobacteriaceae bacterium]